MTINTQKEGKQAQRGYRRKQFKVGSSG